MWIDERAWISDNVSACLSIIVAGGVTRDPLNADRHLRENERFAAISTARRTMTVTCNVCQLFVNVFIVEYVEFETIDHQIDSSRGAVDSLNDRRYRQKYSFLCAKREAFRRSKKMSKERNDKDQRRGSRSAIADVYESCRSLSGLGQQVSGSFCGRHLCSLTWINSGNQDPGKSCAGSIQTVIHRAEKHCLSDWKTRRRAFDILAMIMPLDGFRFLVASSQLSTDRMFLSQ